MNTDQSSKLETDILDAGSLAQSVKAIQRSIPATSDAAYSYFADQLKRASTVAEDLNNKVTEALTSLPVSLDQMKMIQPILDNIAKINESEKNGEISADRARAARQQLHGKLKESVSSTFDSFKSAAAALSEDGERLANFARIIDARLQTATATETANLTRAKADAAREEARLETLEERLDKLNKAVDEKRGGPTEDLANLIPDAKELSSLLEGGAEGAAAPAATAAKKGVELAVAEIKKVLALIDKTIAFTQLTELRDQVFKATMEQRVVVAAAQERVRAENEALGVLDTIKKAGAAMPVLAAESNKLATAFSGFTSRLADLDGQQVKANSFAKIVDDMKSYLEQCREARNKVILT